MPIIPIITRTTGAGRSRPRCSAKVRQGKARVTGSSLKQARRKSLHERLGIPFDQCGCDAHFVFNGKPLCRSHAGAVALAVLCDLTARSRGLAEGNDNDKA